MAGNRRIDRITTPDYLDGVESIPLDQVRARRDECLEEETALSYARRLLHGRMDILRAELDRRAGKEGSLLDHLAEILADDEPMPARGAFPTLDPDFSQDHPKRLVERLISDDTLMKLSSLSPEEIEAVITTLSDAERDVSAQRRTVHDVLDRVTAEMVRRYKSGEADPADLLAR